MHIAYHRAFETPNTSAIVELEERPRIPVYLVEVPAPKIGRAVMVAFAPTENDASVPVARCV